MTPPEAAWHILKFIMHKNSHIVYRLQIHLPNARPLNVVRNAKSSTSATRNAHTEDDDELSAAEEPTGRITTAEEAEQRRSMLTEWFELNKRDTSARQYLYSEIPKHYVWKFVAGNKSFWSPRQRHASRIISRMYSVSPQRRELFHMRLLLLYVRGPCSFEELRTVPNQDGVPIVHKTFEEACEARNLLANDQEWFNCLEEAVRKDMPSTLRRFFAYILIFCEVGDPQALWTRFKCYLMEDYVKKNKMPVTEAELRTIHEIKRILAVHSLPVTQYGFVEPKPLEDDGGLENEAEETVTVARIRGDSMIASLNWDQRKIFDRIIKTPMADRLFHVKGAAGTGKTFLYNTLLTVLEGRSIKTVAVAWTGLAASLLKGGRTVHSQFQLPIPVLPDSRSRLSGKSSEGINTIQADFIVWDEISLTPAVAFDLVDATLRRLCHDERPFGGKTVVVGGDFKQCLPVVENGDRTLTLKACVKESRIWRDFIPLTLNINMRVLPDEVPFMNWLRCLGTGTLAPHPREGMVEIPSRCLSSSLESLIKETFFIEKTDVFDPIAVVNNAILTPLNVTCSDINKQVLAKIPGEMKTYLSVDSIDPDDDAAAEVNYPVEFLNKLSPTGYPPHCLELKVNATVVLLRNLDVREGLCNGTRIVLRELNEHYLDGETIGSDGRPSGTRIFIPRVDTAQKTNDLPHIMKRRQFPVRLAYAMTINKAQGQTLTKVGIYLPHPVFDHGQLYVAFSRARSIDCVRVFVQNYGHDGRPLDRASCNYTKNVVFQEVLHDEEGVAERLLPDPPPIAPQRFGHLFDMSTRQDDRATEGDQIGSSETISQRRPCGLMSYIISENPKRGLISGLDNLHPKVSCYANVIVQCMLQIPELLACTATPNASNVERLLGKLCHRRVRDCLQLRRLLSGCFADEQRQDCQEFLMAIFDRLPPTFRALFDFTIHLVKRCPSCDTTTRTDQRYEQILDGFLHVTLPSETNTSFAKLFAWSTSEHFCEHCNVQLLQSFRFTHVSRYLMVVLSRSLEDGSKNNIEFEEFDPERVDFAGQKFCTKATVRHLGQSIRSGHYVCNLRNDLGFWAECNDSKVSLLDKFDATLRDVYILIMETV